MENVAVAITLAVTKEGSSNRIYNVGEAKAMTEAEWVQEIGRSAGWSGEVIAASADLLPKHLVEDYDYRVRGLTKTCTGASPRVSPGRARAKRFRPGDVRRLAAQTMS